ncbi:NNP family nitrate/nitrite transporter-like MFS transporter [Hydromonas duriensis]|uniref:NNP family nitrate/nitrite transporter-like MFS transporter n=2 Tax=Hydromonas duriensis TaxID=1527608 RepID=A0A4V3DJG1_9BURK|nr:MFS transporter [Hydromonas duriensis]TDR27716.1 NNP family nitrate/nitrite transporter-like MFS transporter [Hydromonas duriensis]
MAKLITHWNSEDAEFWRREGRAIARRNLWISVPALFLAFAVWQIFSVTATFLPEIGFKYTKEELFTLAGLPALSGATLRIFYSFVVPVFGGRRWTAFSTASLLIPLVGLGMAVQNPDTPYWVMQVLALLCGFGSANFSSSMSNISFFFPKAEKGAALGINAGFGNLGVSAVQFVVPVIVTMGVLSLGSEPQVWTKAGQVKTIWLQNAAFFWVPLVALAAVAAWFGMNDLSSAKASFLEQSVIFKRKHNWLMCWLYLGTFGSFIGFAAGFGLLMKGQFPHINATQYTFLGALIGALSRVVGGKIADKVGAARVTTFVFAGMIAAVCGVLFFLPDNGQGGSFTGFFACFIILFALTGVGNASTFAQVPKIFSTLHERMAAKNASAETIAALANKEAAAVLGFSAAMGAYGGFFIPKSYGLSISMTGGVQTALLAFIAFYVSCLLVNWWFYSRKNAEVPC